MGNTGCCSLSVSIIKIIQDLGFRVFLSSWDWEGIWLVIFGLPSAKTKACVKELLWAVQSARLEAPLVW